MFQRARAEGALFGLAVGDALGTTHEFMRLPAPPYPSLALEPLQSVVGGGPFGLEPGQVTDDTQMACCLARSLVDRGTLDTTDVARRYAQWAAHAFDIGQQTSAAVSAFSRGCTPREAGKTVWEASGRNAAGNGSLMRCAPIAVFFEDPELRRTASLHESAITHFDPRCALACASFNAALGAAIYGGLDAEGMRASAESELALATEVLLSWEPELRGAILDARAALAIDLQLAATSDPELYRGLPHIHRHQGFVRVAYRMAFWLLRHAADVGSALRDAANRGGDADTNAAIAGALLGACHGVSGLPEAWLAMVRSALVETPQSVWYSDYHPRYFADLVAHVELSANR